MRPPISDVMGRPMASHIGLGGATGPGPGPGRPIPILSISLSDETEVI